MVCMKDDQLLFNEITIASTVLNAEIFPHYKIYEMIESDLADYDLYFILSGDKYTLDDTPKFNINNNEIEYIINGSKFVETVPDEYVPTLNTQFPKKNNGYILLETYNNLEKNDINYLTFAIMFKNIIPKYKLTQKFNILYIGQSIAMVNRLQKHEILQKILSDFSMDSSNKEIYILAVRIGINQQNIFNPESTSPLKYGFNHEIPNIKETKNILEAMLIYHFQPRYNNQLRKKFPYNLSKSYKRFFDLEYWNTSFDYYFQNKNHFTNFCEFYSNDKVMKPFEYIIYSLRRGSDSKELGVFYDAVNSVAKH